MSLRQTGVRGAGFASQLEGHITRRCIIAYYRQLSVGADIGEDLPSKVQLGLLLNP
jgi:hypothetical protein